MTPDSPETRIGILERTVAKTEQRVEDLSSDVRALMPLIVAVAEMRVAITQVEAHVVELGRELHQEIEEAAQATRKCRDGVDRIEKADHERDLRAAQEYKLNREASIANRRWIILALVGASGVIVAALSLIFSVIEKAPT